VLPIIGILITSNAYAEDQIFITQSGDINKVIFDGKWSYMTEWKESSLNTFNYNDGTIIQFRSAHDGNFIYFLIDDVSDTNITKISDQATICLSKNKTEITNMNDYCFISTLDGDSFVLQGNSSFGFNSNFRKINNPPDFIGIGNVSDSNDRYTDIPHASYEFRIPVDYIGRSDVYRIYVNVHNSYSNKIYSWPQNVSIDSIFKIPSTDKWGYMISPDKSLPEFPWPVLALVSSLAIISYMTRRSTVLYR
jgi:hypothetical protein